MQQRTTRIALVLICLGMITAGVVRPAAAQLADPRLAEPEGATGRIAKPAVIAQRHMVVAANPLAAGTGRDILRAGGSAVDAAIAIQMVLTLVEPQSSGIGGGAFVVHWDDKARVMEAIDGRETAPVAATPGWFLAPDGKPATFNSIVGSPLSVGVPGVLRALELAHQRHGRLPWARLFVPAIALSEAGFTVSPRLALLLTLQRADYFNPEARALYFDEAGRARQPGYLLRNPALAATLRLIAEQGASAFYSGDHAAAIVAALTAGGGPHLTLDDLKGYKAEPRNPVCPLFRGYKVCSLGAPSSGGITAGMALGMMDAHAVLQPLPAVVAGSDEAALLRQALPEIRILAEAEKLAYADRDRYIADPAFVAVPRGLLDPGYLASRARLIDPDHPGVKAEPGTPALKSGQLFGTDATIEKTGTSHFSIVDDDGNALAMTTTVQTAFGSGIMAGGYLLNSQLTDFSFAPAGPDGTPAANRIEGGKRPRSSMAPTIVFDPKGSVFAVLGSPGGSRIIMYNLKALVCLIAWQCSPGMAAGLPTFGNPNTGLEVERETTAETVLAPLLSPDGAVKAVEMTSGLAIIVRRNSAWEGAADPRREGIALGD